MICYRDRTFCTAACANDQCGIKLTEAVKEAAAKSGLPVSFADYRETCEIFIPEAIPGQALPLIRSTVRKPPIPSRPPSRIISSAVSIAGSGGTSI